MRLYFSSKLKRNLFPILTISITMIFVLYFLLSNGGVQNLGEIVMRLRWEWLALAIVASGATFLLEGFTLNLFCRHVCPWWSFGRLVLRGHDGPVLQRHHAVFDRRPPMQIYAMNKMGLDTGKAGSIIAMKRWCIRW